MTGRELTAVALPRSSEITMPVYPSCWRSRPVMIGALNAATE